MINLTLKQLRYFEALAQHRHFGRAAAACAISQPAMSEQIKELEESLGAALFERGARQVRITGFGEEFALRVRDILRSVDELEGLARASRARPLGRLRIGVIPTVAPYLLPTIIRNLTRLYADLDINVRETVTSKLIEELAEGRLDTAIVALPLSEPSFAEVALFSEEFLLVRSSEFEGQPPPNPQKLREMRLLLLEEGHCFRDQALSFCSIHSGRPREVLDASSLSTLVQMVGAGIGVTLIPEMAVGVETRSASVSVTRFESPKPSRKIGMIWRKTSPLTQQFLQISEVVRESADALRARREFPSPLLRGGVRGGALAATSAAERDSPPRGEPHPRPLPVKNGEGRVAPQLRPQAPDQRGGRFSRKAETPSRKSRLP